MEQRSSNATTQLPAATRGEAPAPKAKAERRRAARVIAPPRAGKGRAVPAQQ
eukprot:gene15945-5401_t